MNYQDLSMESVQEKIEELRASLYTIQERVGSEFACDHARVNLYYQVCIDGTRQYRRRCADCFQAIGKSPLSHKEVAGIVSQSVEWNPDLLEARNRKRWGRAEELRTAILQEINDLQELEKKIRAEEYARNLKIRAEEYSRYLLTDKWRSKRSRVLQRDGYICQACLLRPATQVHHKTYDHIFDEPLFDLESVCDTCHDALHPEQSALRRAEGRHENVSRINTARM